MVRIIRFEMREFCFHLGRINSDYSIRKDESSINEINTQDEIVLYE